MRLVEQTSVSQISNERNETPEPKQKACLRWTWRKRLGVPSKYTMITKTYWRGMMRKFSWIFLLLLTINSWAHDGVKPVLGEKIVWEKDGSELMLIPGGTFEMGITMTI